MFVLKLLLAQHITHHPLNWQYKDDLSRLSLLKPYLVFTYIFYILHYTTLHISVTFWANRSLKLYFSFSTPHVFVTRPQSILEIIHRNNLYEVSRITEHFSHSQMRALNSLNSVRITERGVDKSPNLFQAAKTASQS